MLKGLKFYCLNGNEACSYCFKRVSGAFLKKGGKKFIIKNLFGYSCENDDDDSDDIEVLKEQVDSFFSNVIKSCSSALFRI